jgi:hypothetical protein
VDNQKEMEEIINIQFNNTKYFLDPKSGEFQISGELPTQDEVYEFAMIHRIPIDEKIFNLLNELLLSQDIQSCVYKIKKFFENYYRKDIEIIFLEDGADLELKNRILKLPIISKNSGRIGHITFLGDFSIKQALGFLAFYDSFVSVIEGLILSHRLEELFKSALNTLYLAFSKRTRLSEDELLAMEKIALEIAMQESINQEQCLVALRIANVGLIGVRDELFDRVRSGNASPGEYAEYFKHIDHGYEILKELEFSKELIDICLYHHETLDGKGPRGFESEEIPTLALIVGLSESLVLLNWNEKILRKKYPSKYVDIALRTFNAIQNKG